MSNLTVTVTPVPLADQSLPPITIKVSITDSTGNVQTLDVPVSQLTNGNWVAAFTDLADGSGTATAGALASDGTPIGTPISGTFTLPIIVGPTVQIPGSLTFS